MKKNVLILIALVSFTLLSAQKNTFHIIGKLPSADYNGQKVYLQKIDEQQGMLILDSVIVEKATFKFTGIVPAKLSVRYVCFASQDIEDIEPVYVVLEEGNISVDMNEVTMVGGTAKNDEYQSFLSDQDADRTSYYDVPVEPEGDEVSQETFDELDRAREIIVEEMTNKAYLYASKNMDNELGELLIITYADYMTYDQLNELMELATDEFVQSVFGQNILSYYVNGEEDGEDYSDSDDVAIEAVAVDVVEEP